MVWEGEAVRPTPIPIGSFITGAASWRCVWVSPRSHSLELATTLREPFIHGCDNYYGGRGNKDIEAAALVGGHIGPQPAAMFQA